MRVPSKIRISFALSMHRLFYCIQIANDPHRIAMPQKHFPVSHVNAHALVPPHISSTISDAANTVSANRAPTLNLVIFNLYSRNRSQAETNSRYFNTEMRKPITKTQPCHHADA